MIHSGSRGLGHQVATGKCNSPAMALSSGLWLCALAKAHVALIY